MGSNIRFEPVNVVADPAELLSGVKRFQELIEARDGLKGTYEQLLAVPRVFFWGLLSADAGMVVLFVCVVGFASGEWLLYASGSIVIVALVVLGIALWKYRQYQEALADAEILSSSGK